MKQPSVIVFISHDAGRHLSPYGVEQVATPSAERLASEGVLFENCFCTSPLCSPSRAALFTGRYPHQTGVDGLVDRRYQFDLRPNEIHLARRFKDAGYRTALCGFLHETLDFTRVGFESAMTGCGSGNNGGGDLREAPADIERWLGAIPPEQPFYLQIGCHEVHREWDAFEVEPDDSRGVWMPPYLRELPELRTEMAQMQGSVRRLDETLGRILRVLDESGRADDTIFIHTTDHGIDLPRAKGTFFDPGLGVYLIMRYPGGGWATGSRRRELTSHVDVLPTVLEACGLEPAGECEGRSLISSLRGEPDGPGREFVFAEKTFHDTYDPTRCVRSARFKYVRYFERSIFQDPRLASVTRYHYFKDGFLRPELEEFYDLEADPHEEHNLASDSGFESEKQRHMRALAQWMRETDDPLLRGPVASPIFRQTLAEFERL